MTENKDTQGFLYYDGSCSFCLRWIDRVRKPLAGKAISVLAFEDGASESEMKLHWHDGRIFGGAEAVFFLARRFWWLFPVGALGMIWGFRDLGSIVYRKIAAKRHCRDGRKGRCSTSFRDEAKQNQKRAVLAGGSGFLGQALAGRLVNLGWQVIILTRRPSIYRGAGEAVFWDGKTCDPVWANYLEGATALVNLTGKNVNCRPSKKNREVILQSRVNSVRALGEALRRVSRPPEVWIQTSSLAIYGDGGDRVIDESGSVPEDEYPANVCVAWEEELGSAVRPEMRWVILRIGFVLGRRGGALPFLAKLARWGLGGRIGNGKQWISWIHLEDILSIFLTMLDPKKLEGIFNVSSLQPVTNAEFMAALRITLHRPWSPAAPELAVRIGAPILNSDPQIALTGRRCLPLRLHETGFKFRYQELADALDDLFKHSGGHTSDANLKPLRGCG